MARAHALLSSDKSLIPSGLSIHMDQAYRLFLQRSWLLVSLALLTIVLWRVLHWNPAEFYDAVVALVTWQSVAVVGLTLLGNELIE